MSDFFVRKYASPEPSATQGAEGSHINGTVPFVGTEEDSSIPQNITVPNGNAMNWTWYPAS